MCKALASFLFNDEQRGLININMSEYHDRHTISRLIGAAPGYVGFEEGGQLTETVRRKPYGTPLFLARSALDNNSNLDVIRHMRVGLARRELGRQIRRRSPQRAFSPPQDASKMRIVGIVGRGGGRV